MKFTHQGLTTTFDTLMGAIIGVFVCDASLVAAIYASGAMMVLLISCVAASQLTYNRKRK